MDYNFINNGTNFGTVNICNNCVINVGSNRYVVTKAPPAITQAPPAVTKATTAVTKAPPVVTQATALSPGGGGKDGGGEQDGGGLQDGGGEGQDTHETQFKVHLCEGIDQSLETGCHQNQKILEDFINEGCEGMDKSLNTDCHQNQQILEDFMTGSLR